MQSQAIDLTKPKTISDLAREFLDDHGGRTAPAIEALQALIMSDEALRLSIATDAVMMLAAMRVQAEMRDDRSKVWSAANMRAAGTAPKAKTSIAALANGIAASLMNFPLAGGVRLGDATREEVQAQAGLYAKTAADMGHKARWLRMIADRIPDGKTVGAVLTDADVTAMHGEAANA